MKAEVKKIIKQMEESKKIIAKERDKLRILYEEIEGILESIDAGLEGVTIGLSDLQTGIDVLSEYL